MDCKYDVVGGYVPSFVQHLEDTGARLGLRRGSQANEDWDPVEETEANALPNWTPAEQDAFFRAISVHSRWRPDLIAACIPTKTEWEVWMYLEALEEGATALAGQRGDEDVDMDGGLVDERQDVEMQVDFDSRSHSSSGTDRYQDVCEPALEVSQAWVDAEERMAAWIIDQGHLASVESGAAADTGEVDDGPKKRKRGRPRGAGKGRARGQRVSTSSPSPVERLPSPGSPSTSAREHSRDSSTSPAREREALMGRLETPHLLVLDSVLRKGEEAMLEQSRGREGLVTAATLMEHGDDGAPRVGDMDGSSLSDRITATSNVLKSSSNVVIDPVLLALTGDADPAKHHPSQATSGTTAASCTPAHAPAQSPSSSPDASSQHTSFALFFHPGTSDMCTSPQDNATLTHPDSAANAESDLSLFSPRTRRRIQKRLYMRRRRASLRENDTVSEGAIGTGIKKLKPGKKAKLERRETSVVPTSVPCSEAPSDDEAELPENVPKKNKPGLNLVCKLKAQFAELGVDAVYLRNEGMDLLNLGALGKLMGLYSSLEHEEEEAETTESIDAELIRHLQAAMVSFVTDIIHRAIVWREREIRLKQRSRAWRHGEQITIGAVEHAVDVIGARYHSHKSYFKSVEAFHGRSLKVSSAPGDAAEEEPNLCVDPDVGAADLSAELPALPPHRDIYTPVVYPPSACQIRPLTCLTWTYEQEATRTRRGTSAEAEEEEVMSDETDEEALEAALVEEDERDERDIRLAATEERALWDSVRNRLDN